MYKTLYTWKSQTGRPQTGVLNCAEGTLFSSCLLRNSNLCENISRPRNIVDLLNQTTGSLKTFVIVKALIKNVCLYKKEMFKINYFGSHLAEQSVECNHVLSEDSV